MVNIFKINKVKLGEKNKIEMILNLLIFLTSNYKKGALNWIKNLNFRNGNKKFLEKIIKILRSL